MPSCKKKPLAKEGLPSVRALGLVDLQDDQRHSVGRYFESTVVSVPAEAVDVTPDKLISL
jgi:hypothetical protein